MMIIFEKSDNQKYSSQGGGYSKESGYHIWYKEANGEMHFIGYILDNNLDDNVEYYRNQGDVVEIRG